MSEYACEGNTEGGLTISLDIENTGDHDGAEVVQIYLSGKNCDVVMPLIELKAYRRISLQKGEKKAITIEVSAEAFFYYDRNMVYGMHDGDYTVSIRTSSTAICAEFEAEVRSKKVNLKHH